MDGRFPLGLLADKLIVLGCQWGFALGMARKVDDETRRGRSRALPKTEKPTG